MLFVQAHRSPTLAPQSRAVVALVKVIGRQSPSRLPEQAINLYMSDAVLSGEEACQSRLARSGVADDHDPGHAGTIAIPLSTTIRGVPLQVDAADKTVRGEDRAGTFVADGSGMAKQSIEDTRRGVFNGIPPQAGHSIRRWYFASRTTTTRRSRPHKISSRHQ
jgi:hypothetical protein